MSIDAEKEKVVAEGRYVNNGYYAPEICAFCHKNKAEGKGGPKCCEHMGCLYSPMDFQVLKSDKYTHEERLLFLTELLKQGKTSIDMCWMRDPYYGPLNVMSQRPDIDKMSNGDGYLYLRARNVGRPVVDLQFFLEKNADYPCINWVKNKGCMLSEMERPAGGRLLKPVLKELPGKVCYCACEQTGETDLLRSWGEHQLLMYDLYLIARNMDIK